MFKYLFAMIIVLSLTYIKLKDEVFNDNTLVLGASIPKTGIMKAWGTSVYAGANAYFNYVNDARVLPHNKKIKLVSLDDKYEPELTEDNINKLIQRDNLFALFGFVGTPTVKNILPILDEINIPFIAPFTGASFLRNANKKNFVNFRSSYKEEIDKIVGYLNEKKKISKFAVFYQNDNYGEEGYISLIESLKKRKLKLHGEGMYKRNTLSIRHAFSEIKDEEPEAIIMVGAYRANALFIKKAKKDKILKDVIFCNLSFSDANEMIKLLDFDTKNLLFSQVVPSYNDSKIDVIREYKYLMKKYFPNEPLGFISLESFLAAKTIVNSLVRVEGTLTKDKFLASLKNIPSYSLKGIKLNYKNTQLLNKTYLFEYTNSKFKEIEYEN
ncbi:ABC transporter substrate-binding protein [Arcobacter sp. LA11]|uniref:ABC transporter substrate-binding protein n=1 Tax=Arcobacter sp. LA11 TaxID=1898176 RepID=UPI000934C010|nr:ABC transporter substrate-binding protein [Arcobacter sp. LA11]